MAAFVIASLGAVFIALLARKGRSGIVKADHAKSVWYSIGMASVSLCAGAIVLIIVYQPFASAIVKDIVIASVLVLFAGLPLIAYLRYRKAAKDYDEAYGFDQWVWRSINGSKE